MKRSQYRSMRDDNLAKPADGEAGAGLGQSFDESPLQKDADQMAFVFRAAL